jgi:hypothetical protein
VLVSFVLDAFLGEFEEDAAEKLEASEAEEQRNHQNGANEGEQSGLHHVTSRRHMAFAVVDGSTLGHSNIAGVHIESEVQSQVSPWFSLLEREYFLARRVLRSFWYL